MKTPCILTTTILCFLALQSCNDDNDRTEISFIKTIDVMAESGIPIPPEFAGIPIEGFSISPTLERTFVDRYTGTITRFTMPAAGGETGAPCNDGDSHLFKLNEGDGAKFTAEIIADTGGDDVSDDRNCNCDSKIKSIEVPNFAIYFEGVASPFGIQPLKIEGEALCPNIPDGHLVSGDREFGGAVDVFGAVVLRVSPDRSTILADISMSMIESESPGT